MTQLSENFTLEEMIASSKAERLGISNVPNLEVIAHLTITAMGLERVRKLLGAPLRVYSGYRSPALNLAVKGSVTSAHMTGYAADFKCPKFGTPIQIVRAIQEAGISVDQCINEGSWVHISFDPLMRMSFMTAHFGPGGTTYTNGV